MGRRKRELRERGERGREKGKGEGESAEGDGQGTEANVFLIHTLRGIPLDSHHLLEEGGEGSRRGRGVRERGEREE